MEEKNRVLTDFSIIFLVNTKINGNFVDNFSVLNNYTNCIE